MNKDLEFIDIDLDNSSTKSAVKGTSQNKNNRNNVYNVDNLNSSDISDNAGNSDNIATVNNADNSYNANTVDDYDSESDDDFHYKISNEALEETEDTDTDDTDDTPDDVKKKSRKSHIMREIASYIFIVAAAFALACLCNRFLIVNARIPSGSMIPTITQGNRIIGNRLAYIKSEPRRGDVVVFYYPDDESQKFIKRIIGLPGETIFISDGIVYIDGQPLDESAYLTVDTYGVSGPFTIPDDCYFMMGDNRNSSNDSRFWTNHFVHKDKIIAKALFCYYPSFHAIH